MALLFISHSSADNEAARMFAGELHGRGYEGLFLDFDPDRGIPAGHKWEEELYAQLRRADAVVFLASPASVGSVWCAVEVGLARSAGKPVFPVTITETSRLRLLADEQWLDLTRDGEAVFDRLVDGLSRAGIAASDSFTWDGRRSPYPGLLAFAPEDAAVFFGREREVDRVLSLLHPTVEREPGRLIAVIGPSGSGKSSLVNAGVLPRLARLGSEWTVLPRMVPGVRPISNLARSLRAQFEAAGEPRTHAEIVDVLNRGHEGLVSLIDELSDLTGCRTMLLVLDQAEELITRTAPEERKAFFGLLEGSLHTRSPLWVLATMRSEFLSGSSGDHKIAELIDDSVVIEPLSRPRLPEVIERPAQQGGIQFDPGLVQRMIEDTVGGDALPLLAYTLFQLYERSSRGGPVTAADYDAVGGVIGALRGRADLVLEELTRRHDRDVVVGTLVRLATIERGREPTGRRVRRETLSDAENEIMDAFVAARLLKGEGDGADATVEVAHEALLRQWAPLQNRIEASRESIEMRADIERAAQDWARAERDDAYLLRGSRLLRAAEWADEPASDVGETERALIAASRAFADQELARAKRAAGRLRALAAGLSVLLLIGAGLLIYALATKGQLKHETHTAESGKLAGLAERAQNLQQASLFALEAYRTAATEDARSAVLQVADSPERGASFGRSPGGVNRVAWSPDGRWLATASENGQVAVWDATTHREVTRIPAPSPALALRGIRHFGIVGSIVGAVAFGRAAERIAYAVTTLYYNVPKGNLTGHTVITVWDPLRRRVVQTLAGPPARVNSLAFTPDGSRLAAGATNGSVWLWDLTGRPRARVIKGHTENVNAVAFSPDGRTLASSSCDQSDSDDHDDTDDHAVLLSSVRTGRAVGRLREATPICSIAFSPDGRTLAAASDGHTITLWNVAQRRIVGLPLVGHADVLNSVAFSPDGTMLVSGSRDHTVRLWNVADSTEIGAPLYATGDVNSVAFSPDGREIASAGADGIRTWQVTGQFADGALGTRNGPAYSVAFSPDGRTLAWTDELRRPGGAGTVRLWDVDSRRMETPIDVPTGNVNSLAFGPGGHTLAWADGSDYSIRIWDVLQNRLLARVQAAHNSAGMRVAISPDGSLLAYAETPGPVTTIGRWDIDRRQALSPIEVGKTGELGAVAFSPDGRILASGGLDDGTVRLWDIRRGRQIGHAINTGSAGVVGLAFSPNGMTVASGGSDGAIRFWDIKTHHERGAPLTDDTSSVFSLAYSGDGKTLASASLDGSVRLWNVAADDDPSLILISDAGPQFGVAFDPRRAMLASAGDGGVQLWSHFSFTEDVSRLCSYVDARHEAHLWAQIEPSIPYRRPCPA